MDKPKPCPFCGAVLIDFLATQHHWQHPYNKCLASGWVLRPRRIPAWNRRAPVEWTVTREVLRAALRAGDEALDGSPPGIAMMKGGVAIVEALGGKVEG